MSDSIITVVEYPTNVTVNTAGIQGPIGSSTLETGALTSGIATGLFYPLYNNPQNYVKYLSSPTVNTISGQTVISKNISTIGATSYLTLDNGDSGVYLVNYQGGGISLYAFNAGNVSLNAGAGPNTQIIGSAFGYQFSDANDGHLLLDYVSNNSFNLYGATDNTIRINVENRTLINSNSDPVLDWNNKMLFDDDSIKVMDWNLKRVYDSLQAESINWDNRYLIDEGGNLALVWNARKLKDGLSQDSLDWEDRYLYDNNSISSINWGGNRTLYDHFGFTSLDWDNKQLIGNWISDALYISGQSPVTGLVVRPNELALTGQQAWSAANNNGINLSGNLYQTGSNLYNLMTGVSGSSFGQYNIAYTVINNIYNILSNLTGQSGAYIFRTPAISGSTQQFITFPGALDKNPNVICSLNNISGTENIFVQSSGIVSSGYWAHYSNTINSSGYIVTTLASISTQTGLATTVIVNNTITGDFYTNSNPSGFINSGMLTGTLYPPSQNYNININWAAANTFWTILTGNPTFSFSNQRDGQSIVVSVSNTGFANYTGIWPNTVKWPGQIIPVQTSGSFADIYTFIDITGMIYGSAVQNF